MLASSTVIFTLCPVVIVALVGERLNEKSGLHAALPIVLSPPLCA
jgi:hypothetical protein